MACVRTLSRLPCDVAVRVSVCVCVRAFVCLDVRGCICLGNRLSFVCTKTRVARVLRKPANSGSMANCDLWRTCGALGGNAVMLQYRYVINGTDVNRIAWNDNTL